MFSTITDIQCEQGEATRQFQLAYERGDLPSEGIVFFSSNGRTGPFGALEFDADAGHYRHRDTGENVFKYGVTAHTRDIGTGDSVF